MRKTAIAAVLAMTALLSVLTSQASACPGASRPPSGQSIDSARQAVTCLINQRRHKQGLHALQGSAALGAAAQEHSDAMASQNFFSHEGDGTPTSRAEGAGYMAGAGSWGIGENLEWASGKGASPKAIVAGWMRSAEHRSVMLSRQFRQIGIGIADGSPLSPDVLNSAMYTADFGFRKG
jgi:uncharacterized protein YkwD